MTKNISDVEVFKVSLVTKEHNPAVDKANIKHSIFKMFGGLFKSKSKISKEAEERLDSVIEKLQSIGKTESEEDLSDDEIDDDAEE